MRKICYKIEMNLWKLHAINKYARKNKRHPTGSSYKKWGHIRCFKTHALYLVFVICNILYSTMKWSFLSLNVGIVGLATLKLVYLYVCIILSLYAYANTSTLKVSTSITFINMCNTSWIIAIVTCTLWVLLLTPWHGSCDTKGSHGWVPCNHEGSPKGRYKVVKGLWH